MHTARDKLEAALGQGVSHGLGVADDLLLVCAVLGSAGLLQGTGKTRDGVVVRASLQAVPNQIPSIAQGQQQLDQLCRTALSQSGLSCMPWIAQGVLTADSLNVHGCESIR